MAFDQSLHGCETEPGSAHLLVRTADERLEQGRSDLRRNAWPGVLHFDTRSVCDDGSADDDSSDRPRAHVLDRVSKQVLNDTRHYTGSTRKADRLRLLDHDVDAAFRRGVAAVREDALEHGVEGTTRMRIGPRAGSRKRQ